MHPAGLDLSIVVVYLVAVLVVGMVVRRRAARGIGSYYLGDRSLPWPLLALSNAAGMFDVSGTMWLVALCVVYGLKSVWIPWLWPVFNQIFLMAYLSVWLRRSNAVSGADWIRTRFGDGPGGALAHLSVVAFAIVSVLGFLAYAFIGIGKFAAMLVPWESVSAFLPIDVPPGQVVFVYGLAVTCVATVYVMLGGLYGVVWADVLQYTALAIAAVFIGLIAMSQVSSGALHGSVPAGWFDPFFGWRLDLPWSETFRGLEAQIASDGYSLFGVFFMMMLFKGILVSAAGPAPNYDMQRILATRSPRESALMSAAVSVILMPLRYFMVAGLAVLALAHYAQLDFGSDSGLDLERALPAVILHFVPTGLLGLVITAFIAAFMSSFAATVNAASVYLVNDLYARHVNPQAGRRQLIRASYLVSLLMVVVGTAVGSTVESINSVVQWLVSGLWGGYAAANVLKWYWWRLNALGYFWGMMSGIAGALLLTPVVTFFAPAADTDLLPLYLFPVLLFLSGAISIVVSLRTPAEDPELLKRFYRTVRPWGWWGPVRALVQQEDPAFRPDADVRRDAFNIAVGTLAQTLLVALPIYIVTHEWRAAATCVLLFLAGAAILRRTWYRRLPAD